MVNDPKSILKDIQIPDSVKSIAKFVPESVQKLVSLAPVPVPVEHVSVSTTITEDSGVVVPSQPSTTLQINAEDVAAVKAFLESRGTSHNVLG
jgi:hypothetical protein